MTPEEKKEFARLVTQSLREMKKKTDKDDEMLVEALTDVSEFRHCVIGVSIGAVKSAGYEVQQSPAQDDPFVLDFSDVMALVSGGIHLGIQVGFALSKRGGKLP